MQKNGQRLATFFSLFAGLIQAGLALAFLFLPVFVTCIGYPDGTVTCSGESYIQMGGSFIGYGFLVAMVGVGIGAIVSTRLVNPSQVCLYRWTALPITAMFVIIGAWSIGLLFLPGGLLILLPALACRRRQLTLYKQSS